MSGTNVAGKQPDDDNALQYDSITEPKPFELSRTLSDKFSVDALPDEQRESSHGQTEGRAADEGLLIDISPDPMPTKHPKPEAEEKTEVPSGSAADTDKIALERADIEREASEHLARRATEMSLGADDEAQEQSTTVVTGQEKRDLPHTPPPPVPPRKDTNAKKPESEEADYDEKWPPAPNEETVNDVPEAPQGTAEATGAEIQNIMDQFQDGMGGMPEQAIMSPRLERQQSVLVLPPRSSSLEPQPSYTVSPQTTGHSITSQQSPLSPQATGNSIASSLHRGKNDDSASITSAKAGTLFQPPPPSPEPEPALPFDFHRFLEQLRNKTADPVARYLRSFLGEFGKKPWMVHEQVKIISDFLEFITRKMGQCEVWRNVSDAEFDNAREGMEKLVMNRLYSHTFSPAIPAPISSPKRGARAARAHAEQADAPGSGRRGQHQDDVERDNVIAQKIKIYGWIREEHLDIKPLGPKGEKFLTLAQQELLKINSYRAPRDKVICVLNCCKVIFGFLKNAKADQSADAFIPLLIYTVLRARPEHLVSNVQYIWRFRNQEKLGGEAGYYMSSLMGAVTFIEGLDRTNLTISDQDFEKNVEQAVSAFAEKSNAEEYEQKAHPTGPMQRISEKGTLSRPEVTPRNSMDAEHSSPRRNPSQRLNEKAGQASSSNDDDEPDAVTGLLRSIQKPLSSIGRIFSDDAMGDQRLVNAPKSGSTPRGLSPAPNLDSKPRLSTERQRSQQQLQQAADYPGAQQASAEAAQAQALRRREHKVVVE